MNSTHTKNITAAVLIALAALPMMAQKASQQSAVSIVFTAPGKLSTVDTVIPAGEASLNDLLDNYQLAEDDIHLIRLDEMLSWVPEGSDGTQEIRHEVVIVDAQEIELSGEDEGEEMVKVVRINGSDADMAELSEEQREMIKAKMEEARANMGNYFMEEDVEEIIVMDGAHGDMIHEKQDIRIEKRIENGEETTRAWVDGKELSTEEAEALMLEKKVHHKAMFISDEEGALANEHITREISVTATASDPKAVVIVKSVAAAKTGTSAPEVEGEFSVYPNPAREKVTVSFDGELSGPYQLSVTDLAGRTLWSEDGKAKGSIREEIDLDRVDAGTYIITLSHDGGMHSQKVVVD